MNRVILKNSINLGDVNLNEESGGKEIDCTGCYIWPGLIDSHVHFRTPGEEYKEDWITGSAAALAGGITSVVDMPNNRVPITTQALLAEKKSAITSMANISYKLAFGANNTNLAEVLACDDTVAGIKVFMTTSSSQLALTDKAALTNLFEHCPRLLMVHAEVDRIIQHAGGEHTREAAIAATQQVLELAAQYQRSVYLCHVSTAEEIALVQQFRKRGVTVYVEVTPHHLWLNQSAHIKVNPPLRTAADNTVLWQAVRDGVVDVIASDHAPHTWTEKQLVNPPAGLPNIELLFPLLLTAVAQEKITLDDIYRCCVTNPARIFGFTKTMPTTQANDVIVFNPATQWVVDQATLHSKAGWSPFHGWPVQGQVTFARSNLSAA
ncbi:MAG: dihydroorotase [Candidatus Kerfeldbacteria bacterium]|nr:dihydroorotase [Candidatus Kerfeldbacteria bacterium]